MLVVCAGTVGHEAGILPLPRRKQCVHLLPSVLCWADCSDALDLEVHPQLDDADSCLLGIQGGSTATRRQWRNTVGRLTVRPGSVGDWGYINTECV